MAMDSSAKPVDTPVSPIYKQLKLVCSLLDSWSLYYLCLDPVIITIEPMKIKRYCTVHGVTSAILTIFAQLVSLFKSLNYLATSSTRKKNSWPWEKSAQNRRQFHFDIFARTSFIDIVCDRLSVGMLKLRCRLVFVAFSSRLRQIKLQYRLSLFFVVRCCSTGSVGC
jgi:hypothetical protein